MSTTKEYQGHTISLTADFRFSVTGPLASEFERFDSYAEATAKIDKWIVAAAKQRKAESSVAITVLDDRGKRVTIKGIHAVTGKLLGVGESRTVYPDVPWIAAALAEQTALVDRLNRLRRVVAKVVVGGSRSYGRMDQSQYDSAIASLMQEIADKTAAAMKAPADVAA